MSGPTADGPKTTDQLLAEVPLFAGLSKKELGHVSSLATRIDLPAGRELTRKGERGNEFMVILDGQVEVTIDGELVNTLGPGDHFGEIALLLDRPRVATVTATTPVSLDVIGRVEFATMIADSPAIALQLLSTVAEQLLDDTERLH